MRLLNPTPRCLELQCGDEKNKLLNLHYPVKKTFRWSPRNCGDVVFKIEIGNLVLTRVCGLPGLCQIFKGFSDRPTDLQAGRLSQFGGCP
jgi:hypothetical protein